MKKKLMKQLQTSRLILRNLSPQDLPVILRIRNDPNCAKYQRWNETSADAISALITDHNKDRFPSLCHEQRYAIALTCGICIGDLTVFYSETDRCFTLGVSVDPDHQRNGYAYEILTRVIETLQKLAPTEEIVALIHPENTASIALFTKLGFLLECYAKSIDSNVYVIKPQHN